MQPPLLLCYSLDQLCNGQEPDVVVAAGVPLLKEGPAIVVLWLMCLWDGIQLRLLPVPDEVKGRLCRCQDDRAPWQQQRQGVVAQCRSCCSCDCHGCHRPELQGQQQARVKACHVTFLLLPAAAGGDAGTPLLAALMMLLLLQAIRARCGVVVLAVILLQIRRIEKSWKLLWGC